MLMFLLILTVSLLAGCQPTVVGEGQVLVKDNTEDINELEDAIKDLQDMIESLELTVPDFPEFPEFPEPAEPVDLTLLYGELDWIEDELELLRQHIGDWDEGWEDIVISYNSLQDYLESIQPEGTDPIVPVTILHLQIDKDYYIIWSSGDTVYKIQFSYETPLIQDDRIVLVSISKEVATIVDGIFYYDTFYLDAPGLYTTQLIDDVTLQGILEGWLVTDMALVAAFYDDVRTCTLTATCATNIPVMGNAVPVE